MTREEQIRQASIEYTYKDRPMCIGGGAFSEVVDEMNRNYAFEEGAKWADCHPNLSEEEQVGMGELGMIWQKKHLIDKACEWLRLNTNWDDEWDEMGRNMNYGKIEEFRKEMENSYE